MTIVCATEFSEHSWAAVSVAAELAKKHGQRLVLARVLTGALSRGRGPQAAAGVALVQQADQLAEAGVRIEVAVLEGGVGQSVGQLCLDRNASLLVVGDPEQSGQVLATPLDRLAYGVEIPMLVVRDPKPFHAWLFEAVPLKVVLALDHSAASAVARNWIFRLAEYGPLDLVGARIWWPHEEYARRRLAVPAFDPAHSALARLMRAEAETALGPMPSNVPHRVHLEMGVGHIDEALMALGVATHCQLMVLGTHRYRMLARLTSSSPRVPGCPPMSIGCVPDVLGLLDSPPAPSGRRRPTDPELPAVQLQ